MHVLWFKKKLIFSIFLRKQTLHIMVNGKLSRKKIIIFQISNWNIFNSKIPKGWNLKKSKSLNECLILSVYEKRKHSDIEGLV